MLKCVYDVTPGTNLLTLVTGPEGGNWSNSGQLGSFPMIFFFFFNESHRGKPFLHMLRSWEVVNPETDTNHGSIL